MLCQNGLLGPPQRTRPYRNRRIISVMRALFFTGGDKSFATRFEHLFPVHEDDNGVQTREVPEPMVALVATAVSWGVFALKSRANLIGHSCMPCSVSGVPGSNKSPNFLRMSTWMYTLVISTRLNISGKTEWVPIM